MPETPETTVIDLLQRRRENAQQSQQQKIEGLTQAVKEARGEVETSLRKLQDASTLLRAQIRRNPDETTAQFMVFANAHLRLTGALSSGLRRASNMDRMLDNVRREQDEIQRIDAERQERQQRREREKVTNLPLPEPEDAFDEIYGEIVDASE